MELFILFGILGILSITTGVLLREKKKQDYFFLAGGVFLEIYSIWIGDLIFIILQAVYILAVLYDLFLRKH